MESKSIHERVTGSTGPLNYTHISQIKRANELAKQYFFEPATMRFFRSRVAPGVYGGRYFITSEQFDANSPRLYTIREVAPNGHIETVGEFQQYETLDKAKRAVRKLVAA